MVEKMKAEADVGDHLIQLFLHLVEGLSWGLAASHCSDS